MATTDELTARLCDAEKALHQLMIGQKTVRFTYDGKEVMYTAATAGDLRAYIQELQVQLGQKQSRSRASTVYF